MNPITEQKITNEDIQSSNLQQTDESTWNGVKISSNASSSKASKTGNSVMTNIKKGCNKIWSLKKSKVAQIVVGTLAATTLAVITVSLSALGITFAARHLIKNKNNRKENVDENINEKINNQNGNIRLNPKYAKAYEELERIFGGNGEVNSEVPVSIFEEHIEPEVSSSRLSHPTLTRPLRKGIRKPSHQRLTNQKSELPSYDDVIKAKLLQQKKNSKVRY